MKTPEEIFKEKYSHAFDITPGFEGAFIQVAKDVAEEYAEQFKPEWISVEERLPPTPSFVNCIKTTLPNVIGLYFNSSKKFKYASQDHTKHVTHWRYLPEPNK